MDLRTSHPGKDRSQMAEAGLEIRGRTRIVDQRGHIV
jgi:hypothetical protein